MHRYAHRVDFTCGDHVEWGSKFATQPIINIFFNNKDKLLLNAVVEFTTKDNN